jgi:hypothetical protein
MKCRQGELLKHNEENEIKSYFRCLSKIVMVFEALPTAENR